MKEDAYGYGDGTPIARKGSKRAAADARDAEDADEDTPRDVLGSGTPMEATPAAPNGHGRFEHLENGDSTAGTAAFTAFMSLLFFQQSGSLLSFFGGASRKDRLGGSPQ